MVKWLVSLIIPLLPMGLDLDMQLKLYIMVTLWGILMWMFELIPDAVVGILIPVLYVVLGVAKPNVVFSGWAGSTPWITIGGLMLGAAVVESGLVKRIAYKIMLWTGGSLRGIIVGLMLSCIVITPIIPSVMAKVALMTPIAIGLCDVLGAEKKSRIASVLMLVVFLSVWSPKMAFMTASADSLMTASILKQHYAASLTWLDWAKDMLIPAVLWTLISVSLVWFLKPQNITLDKSYLREQCAKLGKFTLKEKKVAVLAVVLLAFLITDSLYELDASWLIILIGCLCFIPGIGVLGIGDFNKLPFSIVFFLVGAVSIGSVTSELGVADRIVEFITPVFASKSNFSLVMSIYIFSICSNFVLNPLALIGTLMGPVADICGSLGYPEILGGYAMIMGFNQALFPYEIAPLMLIYGFGYLKMSHLVKIMAIRIAVGIVFTAVFTYPYWQMMGLLG